MSRIGFTAMLSPPDPNCIVLTSTTSHRLGQLLGTFDDEKFSRDLESHLDLLHTELSMLKSKNKGLLMEKNSFSSQLEVLRAQRAYLIFFLMLAVLLLAVIAAQH